MSPNRYKYYPRLTVGNVGINTLRVRCMYSRIRVQISGPVHLCRVTTQGTVVMYYSRKPVVAAAPLNHSEVSPTCCCCCCRGFGRQPESCLTALQQLLKNVAQNLPGKKKIKTSTLSYTLQFLFSVNSLQSEERGDVCGPSQ